MQRKSKSTATKPHRTAFERAVGALSRRPFSVLALRQKLLRLGYPADEVESAINRCKDLGYLSDVELAGRMSRTVANSKLCSDRLALRHLEHAGIASDLAQSAFEAAQLADEILPESERARVALRKKFRETDPTKLPREKAIRFLVSRGFDWDLISTLLGSDSLESGICP